MFGFEGETATAPIDATGCESNTGSHVRPEFVDFQKPASYRSEEKSVWLTRDAGDAVYSAAPERPDISPVQPRIERRIVGLLRHHANRPSQDQQHAEHRESSHPDLLLSLSERVSRSRRE